MTSSNTKKKLIEVALPLDAINNASAREKSIRHGHPSTLHLWWARRPLAAARAVIFAQMVDDPSAHPDRFPTREGAGEGAPAPLPHHRGAGAVGEHHQREGAAAGARRDLAELAAHLCGERRPSARQELFDRHKLPAFHDPFAGGGALPLEAQRLGLESYASDLNPVAVLINKAMIEIPPKFAGQPPVNPECTQARSGCWRKSGRGAQGLAEDVRYYGQWMRDEAEKRIGHLYPKIEVTAEMAQGAARPEALCGAEAHRDRVALGAHGEEPEPGLRACGCAAGLHLYALDQGGQGSLRRAGDRGWRLSLHGEEWASRRMPRRRRMARKLARGANFDA